MSFKYICTALNENNEIYTNITNIHNFFRKFITQKYLHHLRTVDSPCQDPLLIKNLQFLKTHLWCKLFRPVIAMRNNLNNEK